MVSAMSTDLHDVARNPAALTDPGVIRRVFGALAASSVGREIATITRRNAAASREAIGARIRALEARQDNELRTLAKAIAPAEKTFREAQVAYANAAAALDRAVVAHEVLKRDLAHQIEMENQKLEQTADPAIEAAISELYDQFEALREVPLITREVKRETFLDGSCRVTLATNRDAIEKRRAAIRAAMDFAESLRREVDQSTVADRLAEVIAALPSALVETVEHLP